MFRIQFFVGLPHASPRQMVAEAITMHDDANKAFAEAKAKAQLVESILAQQLSGKPAYEPPVEDDRDYVNGRLSDAARQRLRDERLLELMGPKPPSHMTVSFSSTLEAGVLMPARNVKKHLPPPVVEVQLVSDDGQITLLDTQADRVGPKPERSDWRPSGDYRATIEIQYGENMLGLGTFDLAATTASHALAVGTERARDLIAQLKKEPKLSFLRFQDVHIHVERVNTQISFVKEEPDFDWRTMEFPTPRF